MASGNTAAKEQSSGKVNTNAIASYSRYFNTNSSNQSNIHRCYESPPSLTIFHYPCPMRFASSFGLVHTQGSVGGSGPMEEAERRRRRLARNRESARQSRRRKKQYLELLEEKVSLSPSLFVFLCAFTLTFPVPPPPLFLFSLAVTLALHPQMEKGVPAHRGDRWYAKGSLRGRQ